MIAGATGLAGTHALLKLKDISGVNIVAVCHEQEPKIFSKNISYIKADLTDIQDCRRIVEGVDYVMMFAAKIARRSKDLMFLMPNLAMNFQMLEAAYRAGVKKYLWLSSVTAYPPCKTPLKEVQMFDADPYDNYFSVGWMIRYVEILSRMYATKLERKMATIVLRPTAIYGEYGDFEFSTCHVLHALIRKVSERHNPLKVWGGGEVKRDFIYAGDVAEACCLAFEKIDGFAEFNIGLGKSYSVKELLSLIMDIDNYSDAQVVFDTSQQEKKASISVDCRKARDFLGFEVKTSLREGITKTMGWLKKSVIEEMVKKEP